MSDLVLLGAGASADAGVPTAVELTKEILARLEGDERQALLSVCHRLGDPHGLDVEKVFSAVELLGERDGLELSPFVERWGAAAL
ncbi:MAG: hypothetical protein M3335_04115 [Actinomycetota bacterium]|nr:hypothetical protein [Actinomycetota bacterium]